jgi:hypothetical protein
MADYLEVAREPSLTATEIEGPLARCGHQLEELVAVKLPVAVVAGLVRPRDELGRVLLPGCSEVRGLRPRLLQRTIRRVRHGSALAISGKDMEPVGLEPTTSAMPSQRSPS